MQRQEDGKTLREHLQALAAQHERAGLEPPEELFGPECPEVARHIWNWWTELHRGRSSNGFGPNPIGAADIAAWERLSLTRLSAMEVDWLFEIDSAFRVVTAEAQPKKP